MKKYLLLIFALMMLFGAFNAAAAKPKDGKKQKGSDDIVFSRVALSELPDTLKKLQIKVAVSPAVADKTFSLKMKKSSPEELLKNICKAARVQYYNDAKTKTYQIVSAQEYRKWEKEQRKLDKKKNKGKNKSKKSKK